MNIERLQLKQFHTADLAKLAFTRGLLAVAHHRFSKLACIVMDDRETFLPYYIIPWPSFMECALLELGPMIKNKRVIGDGHWTFASLQLLIEDACRNLTYSNYVVMVAENDEKLQADLLKLGFKLSNLSDFWSFDNHNQYRIFSLSRVNYAYSQWRIVAGFDFGLIAVFANVTAVENIEFLAFEQQIDNYWLRDVCCKYHLLDRNGRIKPYTLISAEMKKNLATIENENQHNDAAYLPVLQLAKGQLRAYLNNELKHFTFNVTLMKGTDFQQKIWKLLTKIEYGSTITYTELAELYISMEKNENTVDYIDDDRKRKIGVGRGQRARNLTRAVGAACSANPIPIVIPCHRVIGVDGKLVGYKDGLNIKAYLLDKEILGVKDERIF